MNIAIVGATGAVGREMLRELEGSSLIDDQNSVSLYASPRSAGKSLSFRGRTLRIRSCLTATDNFDYVLMSAGSGVARHFGPALARNGGVVIDNSSAFRNEDKVPLVVPELNGAQLQGIRSGIVANPNCATIQLVMTLKPLHCLAGLESVIVSTYQSVSGSGHKGIMALSRQLNRLAGKDLRALAEPASPVYPQAIASNILPTSGHLHQGSPAKRN